MLEENQTVIHHHPSDPRFKNLTGQTFGRLTVISFAGRVKGHARWNCRCECGMIVVPQGNNLSAGITRSCGCYSREQTSIRRTTHGHTRNGKHPLYHTWVGIIARCENPAFTRYANWGGRGITVCDRWRGRDGFANFLADMGEKPSPKHSIDRIDVNGNYTPENCRWVTSKEQNRNRRNNSLVTFNGVTQCISAWAEEKGIGATTLVMRLVRYKWSAEKAITTPVRKPARKGVAI